MPTGERERGLTRVEAVVLALIILMGVAILFGNGGCLIPPREASRRAQCLSNLRQLGLGFENYNTDYRAVPSVHRNIWWLEAPYLSAGVSLEERDPATAAADLFRCPDDTMLTDRKNGCSYSPNYEAVDPFKAEEGDSLATNGDSRNWAWSPWSNFKLTEDGNYLDGPGLHPRSLSASAPSTILLIENWDRRNQVRYVGRTQPPIVEDGEIVCPRPAIEDYNGPAPGTQTEKAWLLTPDGEQQWGAFLSLRSFAEKARDRKRAVKIDQQAYHSGRINVLFCDQHVESIDCAMILKHQPVDTSRPGDPVVMNPVWTRTED